jgi:tetratricopeptide (TPR) repeat protein
MYYFVSWLLVITASYGSGTIETNWVSNLTSTETANQLTQSKTLNPNNLEMYGNYKEYVQAGYDAEKKGNYAAAKYYFEEALKLLPDALEIQTALDNVINYGFDSYMQAGYAADRDRNYIEALNNFNQALALKPDSFYAQQAVKNINQYLTVIDDRHNTNLWLLLLRGMSAITVLLIIVIARRPKQTKTISETKGEVNKEELRLTEESDTKDISLSLVKSDRPKEMSDSPGEVILVTSPTSKIDLVTELIEDLKKGDRNIRHRIIWELAQKSDSRGIKPLMEILPTVDSVEKSLILEAIAQIANRTLDPINNILISALNDENSEVRKNAIRDLASIYESLSQVNRRLLQMLEDSDLEVQQTAKWALQKLQRFNE